MRARRRRPSRAPAFVAIGGAFLVFLALALLLSSPRHRRFYLGGADRRAPVAESPRAPSLALPPAVPRVGATTAPAAAPPTSDRPVVTGVMATPAPSSRVRVPGADAEGRIRIPVADEPPALLPHTGIPAGWELTELAGQAQVMLVRDDGRLALQLRSDRASFILYRDVVVDLRQYPLLEWEWKAMQLPVGGDARAAATDDQVAQVYVVMPRWPFPRVNSHVVGYLWDTHAPVGDRILRAHAPNVRSIVVESGADRRGAWVRERRDVHADYVALFGREPVRVGMIAVMSDSNNTGTQAEALFDDLVFLGSSGRIAGLRNGYATIPGILRGNHEP